MKYVLKESYQKGLQRVHKCTRRGTTPATQVSLRSQTDARIRRGNAMWFLCAIAGAVLGGMLGQLSGFFVGAVLGGVVGALYERRARLNELERRLSALESALALQSAPPMPAATAAEPATAPRAAETARVQEPEPAPEPELARPVAR